MFIFWLYLDFSFFKLFIYHAHLLIKFTSARLQVIFCLHWWLVSMYALLKKLSTNFDEIFKIAQQFFEEHCGGDPDHHLDEGHCLQYSRTNMQHLACIMLINIK